MITFVGAGPGAEDLITVRGQNKLKEADVCRFTCESGIAEDVQRRV